MAAREKPKLSASKTVIELVITRIGGQNRDQEPVSAELAEPAARQEWRSGVLTKNSYCGDGSC